MLFALRYRRAPSEKVVICFFCRLYLLLSHILGVSLPPSACSNPLCRHPPLPPRRSPLVLRLFALALADGSGLPFSLYPPLAALESQTPQREARALPRRAQICFWRAQGSRENGVNAVIGRGYNPSVKPSKAERLDSSPYTGEPRFALSSPR